VNVEKPKLIVVAGSNGSGKTSVRATNGKLEKVYSDVNNWDQSI